MWQHTHTCHIRAEVAFPDRSLFLWQTGFGIVRLVGNIYRQVRFSPVKYTGRIRTCGHTKTAANASVTINQYNSILPFECGIHRAYLYARWFIAMHTGGGLPVRCFFLCILHGVNLYPVLSILHMMCMVAGSLACFHIFTT